MPAGRRVAVDREAEDLRLDVGDQRGQVEVQGGRHGHDDSPPARGACRSPGPQRDRAARMVRSGRARPTPLRDGRHRPLPLRLRRGGPDPHAPDARAGQDQGDREGDPPAHEPHRRVARAARRAAPPARAGRTFDVVTQVTMQHAWLGLRDRLEVTATAWYCGELLDRSLEERHAAEPLYLLLRRAYELLDAGMAPGRVARWFEMRLCDELGVRPEVDRCVECDRLLEAGDEVRWIPRLGGVLCGRHGGPSMAAAGLSTDALKVLKAYQRMDVEALAGAPAPGCRGGGGRAGAGRVRAPRDGARHAVAAVPRGGQGRVRRARSDGRSWGRGRPARARSRWRFPMIDPTTKAGARVAERLERELILWLTTVTPAGQPQTSPVWFLWVDGEILLFSRADTPRLGQRPRQPPGGRHLRRRRRRRRRRLHRGRGPDRARAGGRSPTSRPPTSRSTRRSSTAYGWTMESMLVDYPVEIRIRPTRIRAW